MSAKVGLKKHGNKAAFALLAEYCQFKDNQALGPIDPDSLTDEQKAKALRVINLIKDVCGWKTTKKYITKEETTSPTVSLEGLIATLVIDAQEQRDVVICDVL